MPVAVFDAIDSSSAPIRPYVGFVDMPAGRFGQCRNRAGRTGPAETSLTGAAVPGSRVELRAIYYAAADAAHPEASNTFIAALVAVTFQPSFAARQLCEQWSAAAVIGELPPLLRESSGIAASRQYPRPP